MKPYTPTESEARVNRWGRAVWQRAVELHAAECPDMKPLHLGNVDHQMAHERDAKRRLREEGFVY